MELMKILFLDIDGVVNSEETFATGEARGICGINSYLAFLVGRILLETNAKLVLSSSWRYSEWGCEEVEKYVGKIYSKTHTYDKDEGETQFVDKARRGHEIQAWLDSHPEVEKYAILDDDADMLPSQQANFFQTSQKTGITKEQAEKIIEHLTSNDSSKA
jgi:Swiss Army Knife RNA repair-like protein